EAADGARLPELRALAAPDDRAQYRLRAEAAQRAARRAGGAGDARDEDARDRGLPRPLSLAAFRRPAAAGGAGADAGGEPGGAAARRAALEPRRGAAPRDAG